MMQTEREICLVVQSVVEDSACRLHTHWTADMTRILLLQALCIVQRIVHIQNMSHLLDTALASSDVQMHGD